MDYDPSAIEQKWRTRWAEQGRYEADPDEGAEATFVTVPYPYPSGGMHIGHARTYTVPDVWARYRRMRGDNVLFPIAWHVTGTPIVGAVERLRDGDEAQMASLQEAFGVPESDLKNLDTPMGFARYFIEEADCSYKTGLQQLGLSIDWRREFTTNDDRYSKFVSWQYETLKERGLLEKGMHPVNYCTNEGQPVTTHDLLEGEEAEFQEFTLVRFSREAGNERTIFPMATLRPETVRGVTNAFVNPDAEYVRALVNGEQWVISAAAAAKFELQAYDVQIRETISGAALVGQRVTNPVTDERILVLPAEFVDPDDATGVVMSVPAHSPDDYLAIRELQQRADAIATEYDLDPAVIRSIDPVPILEIDDYGEIPARDAVERAGIDSSTDPELHDVTEELYQAEFHDGRLLPEYGDFAGEVIETVRERFRDHHREHGHFGTMYEFTEEVVCRCGGDVEVAEQETWFLRYNDAEWREKALDAIDRMDAIPDNTREQYHNTVDWLEEWPCIRNFGLGTRLPWDDEFVIEPLSDSTIYMAYYTIAPELQSVPVDDLDRAFFDTLFYGPNGETAPEGIEVDVSDPHPAALSLRDEWLYWYPVDFRCSAEDLINNHLTFYLYHHAELFDADQWPRGITAMGMGLLEGRAMSSSSGHVRLPGEAVSRFGADTVRFFLLNSAEPWQDFDWRADEVGSTRDQLERFWNHAHDVIETATPAEPELEPIDRWLLSKLQGTIRDATAALAEFETRTASQIIFYRFDEHRRWYRRRTDTDRPGARWTLREVLDVRLRLLAPFVPFMANELYERLAVDTAAGAGEASGPAEDAGWPVAESARESQRREVEESLVKALHEDVADIVDVTGTDPDIVRVYVAAEWKADVFDAVVERAAAGELSVTSVMSHVMQRESLRERGDAVNTLTENLIEFARGWSVSELSTLQGVDERTVYETAAGFLAREFDAEVVVYREDDTGVDDPADRAGSAEPFRPAVHIE